MVKKHTETTKQSDGSGFWTSARSSFARQAVERLVRQAWFGADTDLLKQLKNKCGLTVSTLIDFGCGVDPAYGVDWLILPYRTGWDMICFLPGGEIGGGTPPGSVPEESFFGANTIRGRGRLFIVESPLEAMAFWQWWARRNGDDVISLLKGKVFTNARKQWLKENIHAGHWEKILFLCGEYSPLHALASGNWDWAGDKLSYGAGATLGIYPEKAVVSLEELTGGECETTGQLLARATNIDLECFFGKTEISDNSFDGSEFNL